MTAPQPTGAVPAGVDESSLAADYTEAVVPAGARRSNMRMFLTFCSMQLVFGAVLVGYDARFQGLTLRRLIVAMAIAAATMTVYCIGSANVGARVGQTHAVTTRSIFGVIGSAIVSLLLVIDGMGFYLFTVLFVITLGQALQAWATGAVVYLIVVALVARTSGVRALLGYSRIVEQPAVAEELAAE